MNKKTKPLFLILGLVFSLLAGIVIGRTLRYKNSPVLAGVSCFTAAVTSEPGQPEEMGKAPVSAMEELADEPAIEAREPESISEWMKFGQLNLLHGEVGFNFTTNCDGGVGVSIPPVKIIPWHPTVFEDGEFGIGKKLAVAWEHMGYDGLWVHSGWDFWFERSPATDLQYFLEVDELNEVQALERIEDRVNNCLRGSQVRLEQLGQAYSGEVAAAVRVPARGVQELSKHTMDMVPYLARVYPQSGFADLSENALLIYFCGRAALDELTDPNAEYWTQTRYVIALEPVD